ncbi:Hypothetical protein, putative [Bodo saltans]|uniref:WD40 repeat-containing protein n=1 Tax=Bodo saltans TaxID=75058 RepID=A0A0S4IK50_BODSA|nr:Hypothetical protein, putative [Bodo saltans]|eukprot:CUF01760.1 Hypothetical protein, putative [Bodo saltans]
MVSSTFVASRQSCRGNNGLWIIEGPRLLLIDEQTGLVTRDVRLPLEHGTALSLCSTGNGPQAHIWVGFSSGTIAILETSPTLRVVSESVLHEGSVTGLQWVREASPTKDDVVVSIATDGRAALWSTSTWECISCVWVSHATLTALSTVFVSPGRLQMVVGTASGNIHSLCPFQQEEAMLVPGAHAGEVRQIVVHAQGDDINSDVARLWTVGTDGSLCVWEASRHRVGTHRSFFRVLSKTPLIQLDAIAGHSILSLEVSRDCPNQILCVLAEGEHFAAVDMTTGSVITMWSIGAPIGDPVLLSPHFRKGWSVLDGKCHDVPTPFVVPSTPVAPPLSSLVVTTGVTDVSLDRSLKDARLENQRLREQIQVLLRSPLQRSSSADHQESSLVHMRSCYASALTVLDNMEHATREFILSLEGEIRSDATSWMQYAQRGSVNTESARHLHAALQELHDERENVSRISHELTELRLKFSSAQQREDVAVMEAAALKRQCSQDREHIMLLERNMTERDAQLIEATRECKTLRDTEAALRQQLDNSEKLLRESSQESDKAVSFIQQLLDDERALTSKLRAEASSVNERTATLREQLAAAVASESNTLQRVTALQDEMERRQAESMTHIGEEHRGAVSKLQDEITKRKLKEESLEQLIAMLREESALHAQDAAARRDKLSRQQRAVSETSAAMIDALHDEIQALREQNSEIAAAKLSIESERDSLLDQVQSQRHLVKEELSRMEAEVINLQRHAKDETAISELAITQRKIAVLETELQVSQNEVEALQQLFKRQRTALEDKILHQASDIESRNEREAELKGRAQLAERKVRELEQAHEDTAQSHASELQRVKLQIAAIKKKKTCSAMPRMRLSSASLLSLKEK